MTQRDEPTIKEALDVSANAIRNGDLETGKMGLKWVLEREPDNVLAWLWMSRCTEITEEKLECFNRVLEIDPNNKHALEGIKRFGGRDKRQESLTDTLQRTRDFLMEKRNARAVLIVVVLALVALVLVLGKGATVGGGGVSGQTSSSAGPTFTCSDYADEPVAFTRGTGRIDVYGGVEEPRTSDVKGDVDPGAGIAVERKCGSWYRVRGVNWWGWLKSSNVEF